MALRQPCIYSEAVVIGSGRRPAGISCAVEGGLVHFIVDLFSLFVFCFEMLMHLLS